MIDFSQQITNFTNYGTYNYKFDDVGNEILNPNSIVFQQVYLELPLGNIIYNNRVLSFYDPTFTEFIPVQPTSSTDISTSVFSEEAINQINSITNQNIQLQSQLESLIANNNANDSLANIQSIKDTIINLRIQSGEGSSDGDFQDVYPYFPISPEEQNPPIQ